MNILEYITVNVLGLNCKIRQEGTNSFANSCNIFTKYVQTRLWPLAKQILECIPTFKQGIFQANACKVSQIFLVGIRPL